MKLCFVFAMEHEAKYLFEHATTLSTESLGFAKLHHLEANGHTFYACVTGIGKVLSAMGVASAILSHSDIDAFVNLGIGGSLNPEEAPLLSAVIGNRFAQHDMDTQAVGDPLGYLSGLDRVFLPSDSKLNGLLQESCSKNGISCYLGDIASGDQFIADKKDKDAIVESFGATMIDMETAAMAEACYVYNKPFASLRIVSDTGHGDEYMKYRFVAGEKACQVGMTLLELC